MEIDKLIKRLKSLHNALKEEGEQKCSPEINTVAFVLMGAASILSTLQTENEKLRDEVERQRRSADNRQHLYENAERAYMKVLTESEQVKRERDAAIESWRGFCAKCTWNGKQYLSDGKMDDRCKTCRDNNKCNWEWRGIKED